jgi:hypothetical protein
LIDTFLFDDRHLTGEALREELFDKPGFPVVILLAGNKERECAEILERGLEGFPARIEVCGRDNVFNVDYIAQPVKKLVDEYKAFMNGNQEQ